MSTSAAPVGLVARIAGAWRDIRASTAREIAADHGEARLFAYAVGGCCALFLARAPEVLLSGAERAAMEGAAPLPPVMLLTAHMVSMLFFTPLMLYGLAALSRMALRAFGGAGGWRETRTAMFWSLVAASPALLLGGLAGFALGLAGAGPVAEAPWIAAGLVWLWFWSAALAEAHRFARVWPGFAAMAGLALVLRLLPLIGSAG